MSTVKRRQYFVDPRVQGTLIVRTVFYWFMCVLTISLFLLCWRVLHAPKQLFASHIEYLKIHYAPALIASLVMLPLLVMDIIKLSNRFTGPLYRLRRGLRILAERKPPTQLGFRDADFWQEFADVYNALLERVEHDEQERLRLEEALARAEAQLNSATPSADWADADQHDLQPLETQ